jgi:hypothetical protein
LFSPRWSPNGQFIAALPEDSSKLMLFDFKTQKWTEWIKEQGAPGFPTWSQDSRYVYYDTVFTGGPTYRRAKVGGPRSEFILDIKDLQRYQEPFAWSGLSPDGSPLFVRDLSTNEIYSLDVQLP